MLKRIKIISLAIFLSSIISLRCWAQQEIDKKILLKEKIENSQTKDYLYINFNELLDLYSKDKKFDEFYSYLADLEKHKNFKDSPIIYYYKALARFKQMQFLEENKMWQEFFDHKDAYTKDLTESLAKAKELSPKSNPWILRSKLLEYKLKKDSPEASFEALEGLFNLAQEYIKTDLGIDVLKDTADDLFKSGEINYAKKIYNVYVAKISKSDLSIEELKNLAESFLNEDKIDLSVSLFDVYLEKLTKTRLDKKIIIKGMLAAAEKFIHSGFKEGKDPAYAEEVYARLESLYKNEAWDAAVLYKRAYNLERMKEYDSCFKEYLNLVNNFPDYKDRDRIYFRLGILNAFVFGKINQAAEFFSKIVSEFKQSTDYLNSLYYSGLLNHWEGDLEKAKEFYNMILEDTKESKERPETAVLAKDRLDELDQNKPIEYNLRMLLDAALKKEAKPEYVKLGLFAKIPKGYAGERVKFSANSYLADNGCLQENFSYLWSGQLGANQKPVNKNEFETAYRDLGTKVIGVVLVSPTGVVNYAIEMSDIYNEKQ